MIDVRGTWVERSESRMNLFAAEGEQDRRLAALEHRITDLENWVAAIGEDMMTRTGHSAPDNSAERV